jgi:SRSO17 transposase
MAGITSTAVGPEDVRAWGQELDQVVPRRAGRFARSEARDRVRASLIGLLGPVQRKNAGQLAEQSGDESPYGVQHLLGRADGDPDAVRDDLRADVVAARGDEDAFLIRAETGFLKKGTHSAGVTRQSSGTAGGIENCQVGVFLASSSRHGTAFLDRALSLPKEWTDDPGRCQKAGIAEGTEFATKTQLAKRMLTRAFAAGVPVAWVTGEEVDGSDGALRRGLEREGRPSVLAVRGNQSVTVGWRQTPVGILAGSLPKWCWHRITSAAGSKGPRRDAWAWVPINHDLGPRWPRWLVVRRSLEDPEELAFSLAAGPKRTTLTDLAQTAGGRGAVAGGFAAAKQEVGLADYEVRSWTGWHRHIPRALLAHAVLAAVSTLANGLSKQSRSARPH